MSVYIIVCLGMCTRNSRRPMQNVTCFDSVIICYPITSFLTVVSKLYRKRLISENDLRRLPYRYHYMKRHSSRHWLDSLVRIQSQKSANVQARTFDIVRRYSLIGVGKGRQTKPTGVTVHYFHSYACTHKLCHL